MEDLTKLKAFIGMPCYTDSCANAFACKRADLENGLIGVMPFASEPAISSSLPYGFNTLWAKALAGEFDFFFMLHADIVPEAGWAKKLLDILLERDADVVSACSPIKSADNLFSVGVANPDCRWGPLFRFTGKQLAGMPETFGIEDTEYPDSSLVVNTGCFVADLRKPWVRERDENGDLKICFDMRHRIHVHEDGKLEPGMEPEDWKFSRDLADIGCKVLATQAVTLIHFGTRGWKSDDPGGRTIDPLANEQYVAKHIHKNGYWLKDIPEWDAFDEGLAEAIAKKTQGSSVVDIGCGNGRYVKYLNDRYVEARGFDGRPGTDLIENCYEEDIADTESDLFWQADWTVCLEVGEHIPLDKEKELLRKIADCDEGAIVSWAQPGQPGRGHVNCKTPQDVVTLLDGYGLVWSPAESEELRASATLPYFKKNLLVFRKS